MKKIPSIILFTIFHATLLLSQNVKSNESNLKISQGQITEIEGVDISDLQIQLSDFHHKFIADVTVDHILCVSVDMCNLEITRELLEKGANSNFKCEGDDVIVSSSFCDENGAEIAKLLVENGADINGTDSEKTSLLSYVIMTNNFNLFNFLLSKGVDIQSKDDTRRRCFPIHSCETLSMLRRLESEGFDLNKTCDNGMNLLHLAIEDGFNEVAKYLIKNKLINLQQKDNMNRTPLDYAIQYNNKEIQSLLSKIE